MVTIYDVAVALGAREGADGSMSGAEFERLGLPMFGGCQGCGASLAAYNAHPQRNGYLACGDCARDGWDDAASAARDLFAA